MGYTVRVRNKVTPQFIVRNGPNGPVSRPNPGIEPITPPSFVRLLFSDLSGMYGDDPTKRVELWEDVNGTASDATVFAACPGFKGMLKDMVRKEARDRIEKKWPLWAQNNCALGIYPSEIVAQCTSDISIVINVSNTAEDAIDAAQTVAAALAVKAVWPEI